MFPSIFRVNRATLAGTLAIGIALGISSVGIARADHAKPAKTFKCSSGTACVIGNASGSGTTDGVDGNSSAHNGVTGTSTKAGASGVSGTMSGTSSNNGNGVFAASSDSTGVFQALEARGNNALTDIFYGVNASNNDACLIDPFADLSCSGTIQGNAVRARHETAVGQRVLTYAAESASATLEDVGTAHLVNGVANVAFDRAFAATIDRSQYHVFLTPMGDTRGLYVSLKAPAGFQVRENMGGRSTVGFDYRIISRPLDAKRDRLPVAASRKVP